MQKRGFVMVHVKLDLRGVWQESEVILLEMVAP
jgi:hypothetical protein